MPVRYILSLQHNCTGDGTPSSLSSPPLSFAPVVANGANGYETNHVRDISFSSYTINGGQEEHHCPESRSASPAEQTVMAAAAATHSPLSVPAQDPLASTVAVVNESANHANGVRTHVYRHRPYLSTPPCTAMSLATGSRSVSPDTVTLAQFAPLPSPPQPSTVVARTATSPTPTPALTATGGAGESQSFISAMSYHSMNPVTSAIGGAGAVVAHFGGLTSNHHIHHPQHQQQHHDTAKLDAEGRSIMLMESRSLSFFSGNAFSAPQSRVQAEDSLYDPRGGIHTCSTTTTKATMEASTANDPRAFAESATTQAFSASIAQRGRERGAVAQAEYQRTSRRASIPSSGGWGTTPSFASPSRREGDGDGDSDSCAQNPRHHSYDSFHHHQQLQRRRRLHRGAAPDVQEERKRRVISYSPSPSPSLQSGRSHPRSVGRRHNPYALTAGSQRLTGSIVPLVSSPQQPLQQPPHSALMEALSTGGGNGNVADPIISVRAVYHRGSRSGWTSRMMMTAPAATPTSGLLMLGSTPTPDPHGPPPLPLSNAYDASPFLQYQQPQERQNYEELQSSPYPYAHQLPPQQQQRQPSRGTSASTTPALFTQPPPWPPAWHGDEGGEGGHNPLVSFAPIDSIDGTRPSVSGAGVFQDCRSGSAASGAGSDGKALVDSAQTDYLQHLTTTQGSNSQPPTPSDTNSKHLHHHRNGNAHDYLRRSDPQPHDSGGVSPYDKHNGSGQRGSDSPAAYGLLSPSVVVTKGTDDDDGRGGPLAHPCETMPLPDFTVMANDTGAPCSAALSRSGDASSNSDALLTESQHRKAEAITEDEDEGHNAAAASLSYAAPAVNATATGTGAAAGERKKKKRSKRKRKMNPRFKVMPDLAPCVELTYLPPPPPPLSLTRIPSRVRPSKTGDTTNVTANDLNAATNTNLQTDGAAAAGSTSIAGTATTNPAEAAEEGGPRRVGRGRHLPFAIYLALLERWYERALAAEDDYVKGSAAAGGMGGAKPALPNTKRGRRGGEVPVGCPRREDYLGGATGAGMSLRSPLKATRPSAATASVRTSWATFAATAAPSQKVQSKEQGCSDAKPSHQESAEQEQEHAESAKDGQDIDPDAVPEVDPELVDGVVLWAKDLADWWCVYIHPNSFRPRHQQQRQTMSTILPPGEPESFLLRSLASSTSSQDCPRTPLSPIGVMGGTGLASNKNTNTVCAAAQVVVTCGSLTADMLAANTCAMGPQRQLRLQLYPQGRRLSSDECTVLTGGCGFSSPALLSPTSAPLSPSFSPGRKFSFTVAHRSHPPPPPGEAAEVAVEAATAEAAATDEMPRHSPLWSDAIEAARGPSMQPQRSTYTQVAAPPRISSGQCPQSAAGAHVKGHHSLPPHIVRKQQQQQQQVMRESSTNNYMRHAAPASWAHAASAPIMVGGVSLADAPAPYSAYYHHQQQMAMAAAAACTRQ